MAIIYGREILFREMRAETNEKKKKSRKPRIIIMVILLVLFVLAGLAVGLYFIIRSTITTTTKKPRNYLPCFFSFMQWHERFSLAPSPVLRWQSNGITVAGIGGSAGPNASQLNWPLDITIRSLTIFDVVEYFNHRVQEFEIGTSAGRTVAGRANATLGTTSTDLWNAAGLLRDANNNLYVADSTNCRIQLWLDQASSGTTIAGIGKNIKESTLRYFFDGFVRRRTRIWQQSITKSLWDRARSSNENTLHCRLW